MGRSSKSFRLISLFKNAAQGSPNSSFFSPALIAASQQLAILTTFRLSGFSIMDLAVEERSGSSQKTRASLAYQAANRSPHVVPEVLKRCIEVGRHPMQRIFGAACFTWPRLQRGPRKSCYRFAVFRDDQRLAGIHTSNDLLQVRLCVFDVHF